ncbi:MAG: hypothetical protein AUK03_05950 [Anaerolineae bacterium CG2_30_64_16]|nr:MAG: hypothetical protein AUK03_05950 [Anaerolineae bacterium CG2_30_64_16]
MALQNATILLIGRAPLVRQTLLQTGYQILWAESGARAMRQLQEEAIDLLVLDDELPDVSASEFLAYVRGYPTTRELPVMLLRGCFSVQDALDFRARGVTEYVTKPVAPSQLLLAIEAVLAKRKTSLVDATVVELGPFVIDMTARQLVRGGGPRGVVEPIGVRGVDLPDPERRSGGIL